MASLEDFKERWNEEIEKIEGEMIDARGTRMIYNNFQLEEMSIVQAMGAKYTWEVDFEIQAIRSRLTRALEIARSKYKLKSRSLLTRIIESILGAIYRIPKGCRLPQHERFHYLGNNPEG